MDKKRDMAIFVVILVLVLSLALGCKKEAEPTTITYWCGYGQQERIEAMDHLNAVFESENPGTKVVRELVPWNAVREKWVASKMAKTLPELAVASLNQIVDFWMAGDLEPINDIVDGMGRDKFTPGSLSDFTIDGNIIAFPHYTLTWRMIIRTDWLEELGLPIPKTWDEFAAAAIAMTNPPARYGFDYPLSKPGLKGQEWLDYFMRTNGAEFYGEDGKVNLNTPEGVETIQFLVDLMRQTGRQAMINYNEDDIVLNFAKGDTGIMFSMGSFVQTVAQTNPDILNNVAIIETPIKTQRGPVATNPMGFGMFKERANKEGAKKFGQYLWREDLYREFLLTWAHMIPVTVEAMNDPLLWGDPLIADYAHLYRAFLDTHGDGFKFGMNHGLRGQASAGTSGSEIENMFQTILLENVPVADAVRIAAEKMQANLTAAGY